MSYTIFDLNYDRYLLRANSYPEENLETENNFTEGVSPDTFLSGGFGGNWTVVDGYIQSDNYVEGVSGWKLSPTEAQLPNIILVGGTIKYQKSSFVDNTKSGYYIGSEGIYFGGVSDATKFKFTISDGSLDFVGAHSGGSVGGIPISNITNIGTSTADAVPSNLTVSDTGITVADDGTISAYVTLTWTAITTNTFDHYLIRYKKNAYTYYTNISTAENTVTIDGLVPNTAYNFGIASVNKYGTQSAFSSNINQTTATSTTAPATVVGVSATAGIQYVIVEWTANSERDIASYNVYRHTADSSGDASVVANIKGTYFVDGGRTGGTELFYWVKAVNTSGLESDDFSTVAFATPRNVASTDSQISNIGWTQTCGFSSTNNTTVEWTAGDFTTSAGTTYNISSGNTGVMSARTYIYLDIATSTTAYQATTTATDAVGDNKVLVAVAENNTGGAVFQVFGGAGGVFIDGSDLVASSVTTDQIAANTIVAGNIEAGTITSTEIDTDSITSLNNLVVAAANILIDGTTYLSNWRNSTDVTKIDGGQIYTGSITTTQLNFTPVQDTDVIASINASAEGIRIDADNIEISGSTTFASGYDPTGRVLAVGGTYDSAASGARVRIFPDANTGIQIIDDDSNDVFKAIVGGTDVGDVTIGNYAGEEGMFYDKSAGTLSLALNSEDAITLGYGGSILLDEGGGIKFTSVTIPTACTATLVEIAGNVDAGTHTYKITYVTASGETSLGTASNTVTTDATHEQVSLTGIPTSSSGAVTARKIYRTKAGGTTYFLLATISDNVTTIYTDNIADSSLGSDNASYRENSAVGKLYLDDEAVVSFSANSTFIGKGCGASITTGYQNTAVGALALELETTGRLNTAIGDGAMRRGGTFANVAIGTAALAYSIGQDNVGVGVGAIGGSNNNSVYENVAVGNNTLYSLNGEQHGNVALGHEAGVWETGSNKLYIDNTSRTNLADAVAKALIYGNFASTTANQYLRFNANVGIKTNTFGTSADGVLGISNGTVPSTSPVNMIQIFSTDISGDDATLGLRTEAAVIAEVDETKFSHKLPVKINGSTYYIMLTDS